METIGRAYRVQGGVTAPTGKPALEAACFELVAYTAFAIVCFMVQTRLRVATHRLLSSSFL